MLSIQLFFVLFTLNYLFCFSELNTDTSYIFDCYCEGKKYVYFNISKKSCQQIHPNNLLIYSNNDVIKYMIWKCYILDKEFKSSLKENNNMEYNELIHNTSITTENFSDNIIFIIKIIINVFIIILLFSLF